MRVAARLAGERPDERYWAIATAAECTLHEHLLAGVAHDAEVHSAYRRAGAEQPPEGDLDTTLTQLGFLEFLGLPQGPLRQASAGLLDGAVGQ